MKLKKLFCICTVLALLLVGAVPAFGAVNGIFLGSDQNGVNILNDRLRPGDEYYFPVLIAMGDLPPVQITAEDLTRSKLEVRIASGSKALASATVEEKNGLAYICIVPGSKGITQELTATVRINYRSGATRENITVTPTIRVGYQSLPEDKITQLEPGDFLELDNRYPIITGKQWQTLAELNDYRELTLSGTGWRFVVNAVQPGKLNLVVDHHPVMDLTKKYPDHQMHFIGFPGAPDFEIAGKLSLDVSELADDYHGDFYLYRCAYGRVYPLKFDYDKDAGEITFRPSQLSTYLITDKRLDNSSSGSSNAPETDSDTPPQQNPDTGEGPSFPALAVALVSLTGLGAIALHRR